MTFSDPPPTLDPVAAACWAARPHVQASAWLHEEIASRMQQRLDFIRLQPGCWLHWEPLRGGLQAHRDLLARYPQAEVWLYSDRPVEAEHVLRATRAPWWHGARWRRSRVHLGQPAAGSAQMVWANMALHQAADPVALLGAWHQALAVDGFLMFSCFGPDTLRELRQVYTELGWPAAAQDFTDMHDWGDMLVHAGYAEPVMDMERITLSYETPERLLAELRELGRNLHPERFAGLRGRGWLRRLHQALQGLARHDQQGRLCLSFEVIYGHALKPAPRPRLQARTEIGLTDMRQMLGRKPQGSSSEIRKESRGV